MDDEYQVSLTDLVSKVKKNKDLLFYSGVFALLCLAFVIRTADMKNLGSELLASDPYVFLRYAEDMVERGGIPLNDTMRYYPFGFDTSFEAPMPSYAIVLIYSIANFFNPGVALLWAAQIYPAIFSVLALFVFALIAKELTGSKRIALASLALLLCLPAFLYRTSAGFADKEPVVTLFSLLMVYAYVRALGSDKKYWVWAVVSGVFTGIAALSGGLFIFAVFSICVYNLFSMLFLRIGSRRIKILVLWFISQLPVLVFATKRFGGLEIYKHMAFQAPAATLGVLVVYLLVKRLKVSEKWPASVITFFVLFALGFTVLALTQQGGIASALSSIHTRLMYPLGYNAFQQSVSENQSPYVYDPQGRTDWWSNFGFTFPLMLAGAIMLFYFTVKDVKRSNLLTLMFAVFLIFFIFSRFSSDPDFSAITSFFTDFNLYALYAFLVALLLFVLYNGTKADYDKISWKTLFLVSWFLMTVIGARGVIRLMFVAAQPAMIVTAYFLIKLSDLIHKKTKDALYTAVPLIVLGAIFIFFSYQTYGSASHTYPTYNHFWNDAMNWVQDNTKSSDVFVHWWDYGYWIQSRGDRATVLDGGNFFGPEIIARHFFTSTNISEIRETLDYYGNPEYLLIESSDVFKFYQISRIGGRESWFSGLMFYGDRGINPSIDNMSAVLVYNAGGGIQIREDYVRDGKLWAKDSTYIVQAVIPHNETDKLDPQVVLINNYVGQALFPISCVCKYGACRTVDETGVPGCLVLFDDAMIYAPDELRDMLFTKVYLLNNFRGIEKVYDNQVPLSANAFYGGVTNIRIYRINYTELI